MNDAELQAIVERCEAATEGPWEVGNGWQHERYIFSPVEEGETGHPIVAEVCRFENASLDADFIANARTDLPTVVKQLQQARRLLKRWNEHADFIGPRGAEELVADTRAFLGVNNADPR